MPSLSWFCFVALVLIQSAYLLSCPSISIASPDLTLEEQSWLADNPDKLVIWYDRKFPPIEFQSEQGDFEGVAADIMRLIEQRLDISFKTVPAPEWTVLLQSLESGAAPIAPVIAKTPEREEYAFFSAPYVSIPVVVITTRDRPGARSLEDFTGLKVAAIKGYVTEAFLRDNYGDLLDVVTVDNIQEGLRDVSFGVVDAMIENLAVAAYYIEEQKLPNLRVAGDTGFTYHLRFAVSREYPLLFSAMEKAMADIPDEEIRSIQNRWLPVTQDWGLGPEQVQRLKMAALFVTALILSLGLLSLLLRRKLKQRMADLERTRQEVIESEERYRAIFNNAPMGIFRTTYNGRFIEANPTLARMLGYSSREELLERVQDLGTDLYPALEDRWAFLEALRSSPEGISMETQFKRKDGEIFYAIVNASLQTDQDGSPSFLDGTIEDITQRKKVEKERERLQAKLWQAQKMESVGVLAGGVAHDFNNILQMMRGSVHLLGVSKPDDHPDRPRLKVIEKSIERAAQLVSQLLLFSRKAEIRRRPLDLNAEIAEAVKMLERTIPKMIRIELALDSSIWPVNADPVQVEQVILNLASNAADAMADGGVLGFETENIDLVEGMSPDLEPGKYVLLRVSDTGPGMEKRIQEDIYDPFFSTKEVGKGTGLGLASVYGVVKAHHGHIVCFSQPDLGTTFKIYWPALPEAQVDESETIRDTSPEGGNETILIVDDEADVRDLTRDILAAHGYTVLSASTGEEALEIFAQKPGQINLVILDLNMPGMGGHKCLAELLGQDPLVRILVVSGYSAMGLGEKTIKAGAAGFMGKPFQLPELLIEVRKILDKGSG
ncbi:response regulator [Desulfonatronovibrio hydrogenovorans]|uniref:response regulator n=1 Tax=Desulfonatronovibrio hydrogenovorans TaxID=53245 RepID=UPI00048E290B|nr:transporter substrate-binding domain-containing protein [Desulfonatronovibrio hydrogenovorans]